MRNGERSRAFVRPYRFIAVGAVVVFLIGVLTVRLWDLQVVQGAHYRSLAEQNRLLRLPVAADRGIIVDRTGKVLVRNIPGFAVSVVPVDLPKADENVLASRLGLLLGRDAADVLKAIDDQRARNPYEPAKISTKPISRDLALLLTERAERHVDQQASQHRSCGGHRGIVEHVCAARMLRRHGHHQQVVTPGRE